MAWLDARSPPRQQDRHPGALAASGGTTFSVDTWSFKADASADLDFTGDLRAWASTPDASGVPVEFWSLIL